jgi:hypothetical protein
MHMSQQLSSLEHAQLAGIIPAEDLTVLTVDAEEVIRTEEECYTDSRGKRMRKVRTTRNVIRRTFLKGKLKGKYWGYPTADASRSTDVGDFYDIQIYESEITVDPYGIVTDRRTDYQSLIADFCKKHCCVSQQINYNQFSRNILVVREGDDAKRYQINLHEPFLFSPKLIHSLHQSNGAEVFGTIEGHICGYLVDHVVEVEETIEEVRDPAHIGSVSPPESELESELEFESKPKPEVPSVVNRGNTESQVRKERATRRLWPLLGEAISLLLLLLLLLLAGLLILRFQLPGILVLVVAALLLFAMRPALRSKMPWWLLGIIALLFGLLIWDTIRQTPQIGTRFSEIFSTTEPVSPNIGNEGEKDENQGSGQQKGGQGSQSNESKPVPTPTPPPSPEPPASFEQFLNQGLKAVTEEEYKLANENFRQAARIAPDHPRLRELASSYQAMADEKCREFKRANSDNLIYIPKIYYQYAASLTQTVPLKCD